MELKALKVSELNNYIKRLIVSDPILYNISVEGEISNYKNHQSGHMYFTIKDDKSKLKCIMFSEYAQLLEIELSSGDQVSVSGYISVYDREGTYQLYVKKIKKKGIGELYESLDKLKKNLEAEGLFKEQLKKSLPFLPKSVGVVTSSTGAAVRDILTTIKRRMDSTNIYVYEVMVQGENASDDIRKAIEYFNSKKNVDVIIVGRGGGSIEELWAFNKEEVVRAIHNSVIPVVSAVGHETDFTLADFVSDKRASTPSVAAEIVVPSKMDMEFKLQSLYASLLNNHKSIVEQKTRQIEELFRRIEQVNPQMKIEESRSIIDILLEDLQYHIDEKLKSEKNELVKLGDTLNALSPLSTLSRGYSIVTNKDMKIISSVNDVSKGEQLSLTLRDGKIKIKVSEIEGKVTKNG